MGSNKTAVAPPDDPAPFAAHRVPTATAHRFEVGEIIASRYRIVRFLGAGGMGEVFEVEDTTLQQRLALKALAARVLRNAQQIDRLAREVRVASRVTHVNVCRVYHLSDDKTFYLMELVIGQSLGSHLHDAPWSIDRTTKLLLGIAEGLRAIHEAGIAHRDLKPANIMVMEASGEPKIMDFGLARPTDDSDEQLTRPGNWVGTLPYMAPEQLHGEDPSVASDIWAFGVLVYCILTGVHPFRPSDKATDIEIMQALLAPVVPPCELVASIPPIWNAAVLRCLERDPSARFRSATDFLDAVTPPSPTIVVKHAAAAALPDLWTPGVRIAQFVDAYTPVVGADRVTHLLEIGQRGIAAVTQGEFATQVALGREVEIGFADVRGIAANGTYFRAEGLRLSSRLARGEKEQQDLLRQSREAYSLASTLMPLDPRPIRGLGRVDELRGDLAAAERGIGRAKALSILSEVDGLPTLAAAHERLRSSRHYVHCLLDMRASSPLSSWNYEHKTAQLHGYLIECENLHAEIMPLFSAHATWSRIEWFMGLVFIAKAWASLGDVGRATFLLLHALRSRAELIEASGSLSPIESENVQWWLSVAETIELPGNQILRNVADRVRNGAINGDRKELLRAIGSALWPTLPPWHSARLDLADWS